MVGVCEWFGFSGFLCFKSRFVVEISREELVRLHIEILTHTNHLLGGILDFRAFFYLDSFPLSS